MLYLQIFTHGSTSSGGRQYFKATADTSLGYFELPSHLNGQRPGPLLDKDPLAGNPSRGGNLEAVKREGSNVTYAGNAALMETSNKGPLLSLALALFGPGSFIASRLSNPAAYVVPPTIVGLVPIAACQGLYPLAKLMNTAGTGCVVNNNGEADTLSVIFSVHDLLASFTDPFLDDDSVHRAFSAGLFLANKLWLGQSTATMYGSSLHVNYDEGIPTYKPNISLVGLILGSLFLALHLLGLFLLAAYIAIMKPWASCMGAEVMVKMGTVYADVLGKAEGEAEWRQALQKLPGFIGDERPERETGRMQMGAVSGLRRTRWRRFEVLR